jgi:hypothetical protein
MIYLIGGVPRAGKSTIANSLLRARGIPYLGLDYLKMAFARTMPELEIDPDADDARTASQLWPFVEAMIVTMIENDQDYTFEGVYILPEYADALSRAQSASVRACFVGFEHIETDRKVAELEAHRGKGDDWLAGASGDELSRFVDRTKRLSGSLRIRCETLGLRYLESSTEFQRAVDDATAYLLGVGGDPQ